MRILQVSWEYPPLVVGGLSAHVHGLSRALARAGHEVVVLTQGHADAPDDATVDGVRVLRAWHDQPWQPSQPFYAEVLGANHALTRLLARLGTWRPHVVHEHDWLTSWTADAARSLFAVPYVATIHATELGRHRGWLQDDWSRAISAAEWWLAYQAQRLVCCSAAMVEEVSGNFQTPREKIEMIPNAVDAEVWTVPGVVPPEAGAPLVVSWGRLEHEKGFQTLLHAAAIARHHVPGLKVVLVGRGGYADDLRRVAGELGLHDVVRFAGFVAEDELRGLLQHAMCTVIPSFYEPFGIVALEAMAAGRPWSRQPAAVCGRCSATPVPASWCRPATPSRWLTPSHGCTTSPVSPLPAALRHGSC
jgi:glycogen synthase